MVVVSTHSITERRVKVSYSQEAGNKSVLAALLDCARLPYRTCSTPSIAANVRLLAGESGDRRLPACSPAQLAGQSSGYPTHLSVVRQ
eukprot:SAG22_NODE_3638_length_1600_cov_1.269154_1_plen_87_part_10